jgi:hypothetical protein
MNLCNALSMFGQRERGTAQLEEGINSWDACLTVASSAWLPESVQTVRANRNDTQAEIARRSANKHVFAKLKKSASPKRRVFERVKVDRKIRKKNGLSVSQNSFLISAPQKGYGRLSLERAVHAE